jgi:hypothetical protein
MPFSLPISGQLRGLFHFQRGARRRAHDSRNATGASLPGNLFDGGQHEKRIQRASKWAAMCCSVQGTSQSGGIDQRCIPPPGAINLAFLCPCMRDAVVLRWRAYRRHTALEGLPDDAPRAVVRPNTMGLWRSALTKLQGRRPISLNRPAATDRCYTH